jgi:hypothetical protein
LYRMTIFFGDFYAFLEPFCNENAVKALNREGPDYRVGNLNNSRRSILSNTVVVCSNFIRIVCESCFVCRYFWGLSLCLDWDCQ